MVEGPDQLARTIAAVPRVADRISLGSRARAGPRRGAGRDLPRARAGRARRADPGRPPPGAAGGARGGRDRGALGPPGRRARGGPARPRDRHDRHGERQVARLQPAGARHAGERRGGARLLPLPDQGARPGPGARARAPSTVRRQVPAPRDLRRRHAARGAARDPAALEPDPHEPGHAARGRAAEPPLVGRRAREPRLGRRGRGARVPRRVRLARGERAAPPAPARPRLRQPTRASCSRAPRSRTRPSWPSGSPAWRCSSWTATARRAPSARSRCGTRRSWTRARAGAPPRSPRPRTCWPSSSSARCARSAS